MNAKKKTYIICFLLVFAFVFIVVLNNLYTIKNQKETWVVCTLNEKYTNYHETVKFRFLLEHFYSFYREEEFLASDYETLEERYQYLLSLKENAPQLDYFTYTVQKEKDLVRVNTFINAYVGKEFFDSYMKEKEIDTTVTIEQVKNKFTADGYSCTISKK